MTLSAMWKLNQGEYVEGIVWQNSGAALNVNGGAPGKDVSMHWIGPG
jgi:hypothetical protein